MRRVIDQGMRTLYGLDTSDRSPEGWVSLPSLVTALSEGERIAIELKGARYLVGHSVHDEGRWWLVPDWRTDAARLHLFEKS